MPGSVSNVTEPDHKRLSFDISVLHVKIIFAMSVTSESLFFNIDHAVFGQQ